MGHFQHNTNTLLAMNRTSLDRRQFAQLSSSLLAGLAVSGATASAAAPTRSESEPFGYSFNTSTVRGQAIPLVDEIKLAGAAGYHAIEPWIREIDQYVKDGGTLKDLRKRIEDAGLTVESAIGFAEWIVDDDEKRAKGMDEAKRNFDMLQQIGGKRLAAPPVGATKQTDLNLAKAAQRYGELCKLGEQFGIVPQVEVWGFSTSLGRLSESMYVAFDSRHPQACLLPDVYHLHRGGSGFETLKLLSGRAVHVFHVNDFPAEPAAAELTDAHRVYPGDGAAPLKQIYRDLRDAGFRGYLSLELFNRDYWQQDAKLVIETGLRKTRESVMKAFA
jgi:sugar phosphate isomerase/epimerase